MKKVLLFMAFFCGINISYSQNFNWITPNKTYLKLNVASDGVYRINKADFTNAGISVTAVDPRTVKVLYKGNQIPIYFEGESDGVFGDNDFFDFYGMRNKGGLTNYLNGLNNNLSYAKEEYHSYYSDTSAYWVDWGGAAGLRMTDVSSSNSFSLYPSSYFFENVHKENDVVYSLGEKVNDTDYRQFNPEFVEGEGWYWRQMVHLSNVTDSTKLKNPFKSPQPLCKIKFFAYPNANDTNRLRIFYDNIQIGIYKTIGYKKYDTTVAFPSSYLDSVNGRSRIIFTYFDSTGMAIGQNPAIPPIGNIYFDYFEFTYPSLFKSFENNLYADLTVGSSSTDTTSKRFKITGFTSPNGLTLYDVRNGIRITNYLISGDTLSFSAKSNAHLQITNSNVYKKPSRIKQKQVPNIVTGSADYIIVYPAQFTNAAEQLRQHRQSYDTLRSTKVNVEDIYDVFNYGMEDPKAVRAFVKNAYVTWQSPRVKYLCLFGRGSLDPKKNSPGSPIYINFVPAYGNPSSDGYFGNVYDSAKVYVPHVAVGRLPAYSEQEASDIVNKIISYDNQRNSFASWWKKDIMITGGLNRGEQTSFQFEANSLISNYFNPNPLKMATDKIYRNDSIGGINFQYSDSIINTFNRGALYFNYIGHAGNGTWDNGLENPDLLSNGLKLPLIFSMTCFTGKNAINEYRGFGEKFIYLPNKGAIGFIGNTGWTFASNGQTLNRRFLEAFKGGSRRQGEIIRSAIMADSLGAGGANYNSRFTLNTYGLLGDPASKILLPLHPEFEILPGNFSMSNPFPAVNDPVTIKFYPSNYGVGVDSVKMRFQFFRNGIAQPIKDTVLKNFGRISDTVSYNFTITSSGNYSIKYTIDPENRFPQEDKTNNSITVNIPIRNVSYVPLKPVDNSFIQTDSIEFVGINPNIDASRNNVKVLLQIDTTSSFANPRLFFKQVTGGVSTKFRTTLPVPDSNLVYYWRMNSVINNDSSGWSTTQRLIYNPSGTYARNLEAADSVVKLSKKRFGQFDAGSYTNLEFNPGTGFTLPYGNAPLRAFAYGNNAEESSEFTFNGGVLRIDNFSYSGLVIVTVNKLTGRLLNIRGFKVNSPSSSDSIVTYLDAIDTNKYVLMATVKTFSGDSLRQNAKDKIKEFGSTMADSLRGPTALYQTWAFIGSRGASPKECSEEFHPNNVKNSCIGGWCTSLAAITRPFQTINGSITQNFGPARSWRNFNAFETVMPFSTIKYNVFGRNTADQSVLLYSNVGPSFTFDTLNALTYPNVTITSAFNLDSLQGNTPPALKSFVFNYIPPVELAVDNYSFTKPDSALQEGDSVTLGVSYTNIGYSSIYSSINTWYTFVNGQKRILKLDTIRTPIVVDEIRNSQVSFSTYGLGNQSDSVTIYYDSYPAYAVNEFNSYNNTGVTQIVVKADSLKPVANITFDGQSLTNGDFIQANPEIVIELFDDSPIAISGADTNTVKIKLDNKYVPYANNPDLQFIAARGYKLAATVKYFPKLAEGEHKIEFNFSDKTGNIGDTIKNNFQVSYDLKLLSLANYPNPFKDNTTFTFNLQGEKRPDTGKIKIYTAAGRLVKEISLNSLTIGYNQVPWDGRDNDGDAMANGIYFYKMILTGNSKIETKIEKIAILK